MCQKWQVLQLHFSLRRCNKHQAAIAIARTLRQRLRCTVKAGIAGTARVDWAGRFMRSRPGLVQVILVFGVFRRNLRFYTGIQKPGRTLHIVYFLARRTQGIREKRMPTQTTPRNVMPPACYDMRIWGNKLSPAPLKLRDSAARWLAKRARLLWSQLPPAGALRCKVPHLVQISNSPSMCTKL